MRVNVRPRHHVGSTVLNADPAPRKDVDRAKYQSIGESDRFTLKFVKA